MVTEKVIQVSELLNDLSSQIGKLESSIAKKLLQI